MNREELESILKKLPHRLVVKFAYLCAKDLEKYYDNHKYSEISRTRVKCLELIEKWLKDDNSVSKLELNTAATYTWYAGGAVMTTTHYAAAYAAYAASTTIYAAYSAAYAAYDAADAISYAASTAVYAASTPAYATGSIDKEVILQLILNDLTDLEKELYDIKTIMKETEK